MKQTLLRQSKRLIIAILLILLIGSSTALFAYNVSLNAEERCWETLHASTEVLKNDIISLAERDRTLLRIASQVISDHDLIHSPDLSSYLEEFENDSTISKIGLLLPDDTVIFSDGTTVDAGGALSFEKESALGEHISDRECELLTGENNILRNYVPVQQDGKTVAMLYGIVELETLSDKVELKFYGDNTAPIYVIDGNTGDFLLDTWHKSLGNIHDQDAVGAKDGFDREQMLDDMQDGRTGHFIYVSQTTGELLYFYYEPCGINQWLVAVSVPEELVYSDAAEMRRLLYYLKAFECICFVIYFIWIFFDTKKENNEKQHQYELIRYIYDVEKILFTAHRKKEHIKLALRRICETSASEEAFFVIYENEKNSRVFMWPGNADSALTDLLKQNNYYRGFCENYDGKKMPDKVTLIPVSDVDDNLIGALGIYNQNSNWTAEQVLDSVAPSFTLLYNNIQSFNRIKEMGEKDLLTNLLNRNSFEKKLEQYPDACMDSIAVIYADANGLHELNNSKGHEAGDRMLKFVASKIKEQFGGDDTYRIGGDEFAAFSVDEKEGDVLEKINVIDSALIEEGYHASIGMVWNKKDGFMDMGSLIKQAEQEMYAAKRRWYQQQGNDRRAR